MTDEILNWLLEDSNPEVKLRTMKEYLGLSDDDNRVIQAKEELYIFSCSRNIKNFTNFSLTERLKSNIRF